MAAGQPDWQRLHKEGKLPKDQRHHIGLLPELDAAEARLKEIEEGSCDECRAKFFPAKEEEAKPAPAAEASKPAAPEADKKPAPPAGDVVVEAKCEHEGCAFVGKGKTEGMAKNAVRMHARSHEVKA